MNSPLKITRTVEEADGLDPVITPVSSVVTKAVRATPVRNALSGTWLGHPVHPMLVSLPIGAWAMSGLFDLVGGRNGDRASAALIGAGMACAAPTAATGLNDWSDLIGPSARVGAIHGAANSAGFGLYAASLACRMRGRHSLGKMLSWVGMGLVGAGGYLGGHLTYARGTNINHAAWAQIPSNWARVADVRDIPEGGVLRAEREGVPLLVRSVGGRVTAIAATCSHAGGALDEGECHQDQVTCPLHGSVFRMTDGSVVRGPASSPQPAFDTRIIDGAIEVRAAD